MSPREGRPRRRWKQRRGLSPGGRGTTLCKECPQFAVESTAVGLRFIRKHWGPINRREVQIVSEADDLFKEIEAILAETIEVA